MAEDATSGPADRQWWIRENLREAIDQLVDLGYTVRGGQGEDPELIDPGGSAVETWREDFPYQDRLTREAYDLEKYRLQVELLKFQYWGQDRGLKQVIVFEGRDAAGKGARSSGSPSTSTPARPAPWPSPGPPTGNWASGTSSATSSICPPPGRS